MSVIFQAQMVLLVILLGAMFNFILGVLLPAPEAKIGRGFLGLSGESFEAKNNRANFGNSEPKSEID